MPLACLALAGCGGHSAEIDKAEKAVRAQLADGSSARFRRLEYARGFVCGEVAAKGPDGRFRHFAPFRVDPDGTVELTDTGEGSSLLRLKFDPCDGPARIDISNNATEAIDEIQAAANHYESEASNF